MALQGTHVRFALDIKDKYEIKNIKRYISGAIYPDSRYNTKIDRKLTHNKNIESPNFIKNDFKKGWQTHIVCDKIQNDILDKKFLKKDYNDTDWYIMITAIKVIQDMKDTQKFNIQPYIKYFKHVENPNKENVDEIKKFNQISIDLYKDRKQTSLDDYYGVWDILNENNWLGDKTKAKAKEFLSNKGMVKKIESIYDEIIIFYKKIVNIYIKKF